MIRIGQNVDTENHDGLTPLAMAIQSYDRIKRNPDFARHSQNFRTGESLCQDIDHLVEIAQLRKIIVLLIEHHADVHATFGPQITPLHCAVLHQDWILVDLLFVHGVNSGPLGDAALRTASPNLWLRLQEVINQHHTPRSPRPPRLCPCHSRIPLTDCHMVKDDKRFLPYPPHFICPCDSGRKSFQQCCQKRSVMWGETWNENIGALVAGYDRNSTTKHKLWEDKDKYNQFLQQAEQARMEKHNEDPEVTASRLWIVVNVILPFILQRLVEEGKVDPEFAEVAATIKQCPPIPALKLPRCDYRELRDKWNSGVDAYIEKHQDLRPVEEIERAAKIGIDGGPLFRSCHIESCLRIETNLEKFKHCSACKSVKYCSSEYQKQDWRSHKRVCGMLDIEILPSQQAFKDTVINLPVLEGLLDELGLKGILIYVYPPLVCICGLNLLK